jgi:hypothetical protein
LRPVLRPQAAGLNKSYFSSLIHHRFGGRD